MNQHQEPRRLLLKSDLADRGVSIGQTKGHVNRGELLRVSHGIYCPAAEWQELDASEQYLRFTATQWRMVKYPTGVVSHQSAAAVWGLPLPRAMSQQLHLSGYKDDHGCQSPSVYRHRIAVPVADTVMIGDIRVTSLARTVIDVAMTASIEDAIICADAAARKYVLDSPDSRTSAVLSQRASDFSQELTRQARLRGGRKGVRQARQIAEWAAWQSESPGESLSRLRMHQLGMPTPRLQVDILGPGNTRYRPDFAFDDHSVFGEFDGKSKYNNDPAQLREQILAEKRREDWIRSTTGWRLVRWGWSDVISLGAFESFARRAGIFR